MSDITRVDGRSLLELEYQAQDLCPYGFLLQHYAKMRIIVDYDLPQVEIVPAYAFKSHQTTIEFRYQAKPSVAKVVSYIVVTERSVNTRSHYCHVELYRLREPSGTEPLSDDHPQTRRVEQPYLMREFKGLTMEAFLNRMSAFYCFLKTGIYLG